MPTVTAPSTTPTFIGWNQDSNGTTNDSSYNITTNKLTLTNSNSEKNWYAITRKDAVTLTGKVNANNATLSSTSNVSCTIAASYNHSNQAKSCYAKMPTVTAPSTTPTVVGWNTDANATTNDSSYSTSTGNLTLTSSNTGKTWYAITKKNAVTLKATANGNWSTLGGSTNTPTCTLPEVYNGATQITSCEVTMPTVTPHNNTPTFVGWNQSASGTTNDSSYNMATNKLTLTNSNTGKNWYAITKKEAVTLTAKVDENGGTLSSTKDVSCTIAETYNAGGQATSCYAKMPTGTKTGYSHIGWNTDSTATTSDSNYGTSSGNLKITKDNTGTIWYAIYKAKSYKVTFNPNGGKVSPTYKSVTFDSNYGKDSTLPTPTRADSTDSASGKTISYAFEGWYTAANGGTKVTDETLVNTASDHSIYAHWISKPIITGGSADWFSREVDIELEVPSTSDTGSVKYQYYVSTSNSSQVGGEWKVTSVDGYAPVSSNGIHYVFYRAISSAGVYSNVSNYRMVKIDTEKPTISVTGNPTSWVTTDVTLKVSASDSVSGLKSVTVNGKALSLNNGVTNYTVSANGTYTFVATDVAGNTTTQNVVVSKIDKVTPTAPVLTGGSNTVTSTTSNTISVKTAGTTGPSGFKEYDVLAQNYLTDQSPKIRKTVSGLTISGETYTTTNSDPYIRFDDFGPDGVVFNNVLIAFTQPTTKLTKLRVYVWTKGNGPSTGTQYTADIPAGTSGWYMLPITKGTYDGLQFNLGGTAGDTYSIHSFRYVYRRTIDNNDNKTDAYYSYKEERRGHVGVYYRTIANNGLASSWTVLDSDSWSMIDNTVAESNNFRYTTLQKAINFATNNTATTVTLLKNISETATIASTKNITISGANYTINTTGVSPITNSGTLNLNNVTLTGASVVKSSGTLNLSSATITSKAGTALRVEGGTTTIANSNLTAEGPSGNALYVSAGTVTLNSGTLSSGTSKSNNSSAGTIVHGGTLNINGGTINAKTLGTNGLAMEGTGIVNMRGGTVSNVYNLSGPNTSNYNCVSAFNIRTGSSGLFTMYGGKIQGCIGIYYQEGATGKIILNDMEYDKKTSKYVKRQIDVIAVETGIFINNTNNDIITIGNSASTDQNSPWIRSNYTGSAGIWNALSFSSNDVEFKMYSGRLRTSTNLQSRPYMGTNKATIAGKTFTTYTTNDGHRDAIWK